MRYHNITKDDMLNGVGLRVVLWVSGCEHACANCHNEVTWDLCGGLPFDEEAKQELFTELKKDYVDGITLSGGDPLHTQNREEIGMLIEEIHNTFPQKSIWVYTGYDYQDVKEVSCMQYVDVLVDGKFVDTLKDAQLPWRGSSNQKMIDVKESVRLNKVVLYEG